MWQHKLDRGGKLIFAVGLFILIPVTAVFSQEFTLLFQEDFSLPRGTIWNFSNSPDVKRWVSDGRYHILIERPGCQAWGLANGQKFTSFRLDIDTVVAACPADNEYGVLFRFADGNSTYAFFISAHGYIKLLKRLNGEWETVVPQKRCYAVNLGHASNRLTVIADGSLLSCYVNGGKVVEVTDHSLACGTIGVVALVNQYPGFQIAFDNIILRSLESY